MSFKQISAHNLQTLRLLEGATVIDVRDIDEYRTGHIPGSHSIPFSQLTPAAIAGATGDASVGLEKPVYLTCDSGLRAAEAIEQLRRDGIDQLVVLEGGTQSWKEAGLPVLRFDGAISILRQMQIIVGTLLVLKILLGFTVHQFFFAVAALIGLSLAWAGIKNWCGLGALLSRMPWNQQKPHQLLLRESQLWAETGPLQE